MLGSMAARDDPLAPRPSTRPVYRGRGALRTRGHRGAGRRLGSRRAPGADEALHRGVLRAGRRLPVGIERAARGPPGEGPGRRRRRDRGPARGHHAHRAARRTGSGGAHDLADRAVLPAAGPRPAQPGPRPGLPDRPAARGGLRLPLPARRGRVGVRRRDAAARPGGDGAPHRDPPRHPERRGDRGSPGPRRHRHLRPGHRGRHGGPLGVPGDHARGARGGGARAGGRARRPLRPRVRRRLHDSGEPLSSRPWSGSSRCACTARTRAA